MSNLRIIADDLGLAACINEGIFLGLSRKWITGASLMANGPAFEDAVHRILATSASNIGIHLVLIEEKALTEKKEIPSLVDENNVLMKNHRVFFLKYIMGRIRLGEIEKEFRAQMERCLQSGVHPSFVNSHQHLHLLPAIMDIVIRLAQEYRIPEIRIVREPIFGHGGSIFRKLQLLVLHVFSWSAVRKISASGLRCNNIFIGFLNAGNLGDKDIEAAHRFMSAHPHATVELGCHPGFEDQQLRDRYRNWGGYHWKQELEMLERAAHN